jgi:hypothetical protein
VGVEVATTAIEVEVSLALSIELADLATFGVIEVIDVDVEVSGKLVVGLDKLVMSWPEDVVWVELDTELVGPECVTVGDDVGPDGVEVTPVMRHEQAEEIFDGESVHLEA